MSVSDNPDAPQQYGIWAVEGHGLVVAFRGSSSWADWDINDDINGVPVKGLPAVVLNATSAVPPTQETGCPLNSTVIAVLNVHPSITVVRL